MPISCNKNAFGVFLSRKYKLQWVIRSLKASNAVFVSMLSTKTKIKVTNKHKNQYYYTYHTKRNELALLPFQTFYSNRAPVTTIL